MLIYTKIGIMTFFLIYILIITENKFVNGNQTNDTIPTNNKDQPFSIEVIVSILSSIGSGIALLFTYLTREKTKVIEKNVEYEYKAKDRIYTNCYPKLFVFIRNCEAWPFKFADILRHTKEGNIINDETNKDNTNVRLGDEDIQNYFKVSIIYRFFAPVAAFKIFEETLTTVDLSIDKYLKDHYELGKKLYYSFSKDNYFGRKIRDDYRNYNYQRTEDIQRQGLRGYEIYKLVEFFIIRKPSETPRVKAFYEFIQDYKHLSNMIKYNRNEGFYEKNLNFSLTHNNKLLDDLVEEFIHLNNIFHLFNPTKQQKPVLLRILIYHYAMCKAIELVEKQRERTEKWSKSKISNIDKAKDDAIFYVDEILNSDEYKIEFSPIFTSSTLLTNKFPDTIELILKHIKEAMIKHDNKSL